MFSYTSPDNFSTYIETLICEIASMVFLIILLLNVIEYWFVFKKLIGNESDKEKEQTVKIIFIAKILAGVITVYPICVVIVSFARVKVFELNEVAIYFCVCYSLIFWCLLQQRWLLTSILNRFLSLKLHFKEKSAFL